MKETFILRTEWYEAISELSFEDQALLLRNLFNYHNGEFDKIELPSLGSKLIWKLIEPNLKRNIESYDKRKDTSVDNEKFGGRPHLIIKDSKGNTVPKPISGFHFVYLIFDTDISFYKIGETQDLLKRRLSIKRPTEFIQIISFAISTHDICCELERDILKRFSKQRISGDWLNLNEEQVGEITYSMFKINQNKPTNYPTENNKPIKTLSDTDIVSDTVTDIAIDKKIKYRNNVFLKIAEHEKLVTEYGEPFTNACYEYLSGYKIEKPSYKTKSDYHTILRWVIDAVRKKFPVIQGTDKKMVD